MDEQTKAIDEAPFGDANPDPAYDMADPLDEENWGWSPPEGSTFLPFVIDSEERANWLLRKLGNIQAERRRIEAQYLKMLGALDKDEDALNARFGAQLEEWARGQLGKRGKTVRLLQGEVQFRRLPERLRLTDRDRAKLHVAVTWPDLVATKTVETYDMAEAQRRMLEEVRQTGEVPDFAELTPAGDQMYIKFPDVNRDIVQQFAQAMLPQEGTDETA